MIDQTPKCEETFAAGRKAPWTHHVVLGAVCALVIGAYAWSAQSGLLELWGLSADNTYYNLLVEGFRSGQLNLQREVPPGLAQLADPYDPIANEPYRWIEGCPLHDLSYYQGRLYLYVAIHFTTVPTAGCGGEPTKQQSARHRLRVLSSIA